MYLNTNTLETNSSTFSKLSTFRIYYYTVVGVHEMESLYKRGALYIIFRHHPQNATTATEANVLVAQSMRDL